MRGRPVGTLKFYYTTPRLLNETQVTMAEGLARLLSTQLELSELERQTELACRMELKALQAQIHPHFLFNTINTIAMLIRTDPDRHARCFGTSPASTAARWRKARNSFPSRRRSSS
jgi:two-component system, LytTR family, sensor histidine kinase LytS